MINSKKHLLSILVFVFLSVNSSGCVPLIAGAAVGAGGVLFAKGVLEKNVDYSLVKVHKAALSACKKLDIYVREDIVNKADATIKGEYEDGKGVDIHIEALTEKATKIKIRIGVFGDEEKSYVIMNTIQQKL